MHKSDSLDTSNAMTTVVVYEGKLIEVLQRRSPQMPTKTFEIARRGPGTRIIFTSGTQILLAREYRYELGGYDLRLPGGKVYDTLSEYRSALNRGVDLLAVAEEGACREAVEEVGLKPTKLDFIHKSICGATVEWDLYYFRCTEWVEGSSEEKDPDEHVTPAWYSFAEASKLVFSGAISEERSALQILRLTLRGLDA